MVRSTNILYWALNCHLICQTEKNGVPFTQMSNISYFQKGEFFYDAACDHLSNQDIKQKIWSVFHQAILSNMGKLNFLCLAAYLAHSAHPEMAKYPLSLLHIDA